MQQSHLTLGEITTETDLAKNLTQNAIPTWIDEVTSADYQEFLAARRKLMATKIRSYYDAL
mgnify:CR=1 FL=1